MIENKYCKQCPFVPGKPTVIEHDNRRYEVFCSPLVTAFKPGESSQIDASIAAGVLFAAGECPRADGHYSVRAISKKSDSL